MFGFARSYAMNSSMLICRFGAVGSGADWVEVALPYFLELGRVFPREYLGLYMSLGETPNFFRFTSGFFGIDLENLFANGNCIQTGGGVYVTSCVDFKRGSKIFGVICGVFSLSLEKGTMT
jgi:hypothetical protein